jgi:ketosteroid isomerase-like protein
MDVRCLRPRIWALALSGAVGAAAAAHAVQSAGSGVADAAIRGLIGTYAKSVEADDTTLASTVWATAPDVSLIHPRGHERGWEAIRRTFYEQTMVQRFSERKLTVKDLAIHSYDDTAWAEFYWDFAAKRRTDGTPQATQGRETQIYRKINGAWRLIHVHISGMPVAVDRGQPGEAAAQQ